MKKIALSLSLIIPALTTCSCLVVLTVERSRQITNSAEARQATASTSQELSDSRTREIAAAVASQCESNEQRNITPQTKCCKRKGRIIFGENGATIEQIVKHALQRETNGDTTSPSTYLKYAPIDFMRPEVEQIREILGDQFWPDEDPRSILISSECYNNNRTQLIPNLNFERRQTIFVDEGHQPSIDIVVEPGRSPEHDSRNMLTVIPDYTEISSTGRDNYYNDEDDYDSDDLSSN